MDRPKDLDEKIVDKLFPGSTRGWESKDLREIVVCIARWVRADERARCAAIARRFAECPIGEIEDEWDDKPSLYIADVIERRRL